MAIRRHRLQRTPIVETANGELIDIAQNWKFTVFSKNHGTLEFDFTDLCSNGRTDIAGHMRDAIWSLRFESEGISLISYYTAIKRFWKFLDEDHPSQPVKLEYVDRECINRYLTWLELQIVPQTHANAGQKISLSNKRTSYNGLKALLVNRKKRTPKDVSKNLTFPLNPFPHTNSTQKKREPYTELELERILKALNTDLRKIHNGLSSELPSLQVLIVYLLTLATSTGANLQPLLELKRDSLQSHPLEDRELLFTNKRRGWSSHIMSLKKTDASPESVSNFHSLPKSIGEHFKALCAFTLPLTELVENSMKDFVFLWQVSRGGRKGEIIRLSRSEAKTGIRDFARRHKLSDEDSEPIAISFSRFRPTFATNLYRRTGDIRLVSNSLGHSSIETTARYYVEQSGDAVRDHSIVSEGMVANFTRIDIDGRGVVAADGNIPSSKIKFLAVAGYSTGIAHCKNPFRDEDEVCKKFFTCFKCPNMIVFEDDLWRLFSFYYRLLAERQKIRPDHWLKTYGEIIKKIDRDISPLFDQQLVNSAKERARHAPHPAWKDPLK